MVFVIAIIGLVIVAAWPVHVIVAAKDYDCGTLASSPFNQRQYRRLYGPRAARACQDSLTNHFTLGFFVIVGAMGAFIVLRVVQNRPAT